ncbi:MAG: hypothetical protein QOJ53_1900 [Sphingomonadales bacterium]|jgi:hypothetical protein|nr:hypothetical protein [Sphingomonadales bacterium]
MSGGRRFLGWFLAASALLAVAVFALTWLVDPYGLLSARGPRISLCAPGIRVNDDRYLKPVIPRVHQPEEALFGSSRAVWGFAEESFTRRTGRNIANLALSSGSLEEIDLLARRAVADAPLRRAWIGLDFGAFALPGAEPPPLTGIWAIADPGATALRYGLFDPHAMKAGLFALADPAACADPPFSLLGFARNAGPYGRAPSAGPSLPDVRTRTALVRRWRLEAMATSPAYADRLARLDALLGFLRSRGVAPILFITPSHPSYHAMVAEAGLGERYRSWRSEVQAIARRHEAILVMSDSPSFLGGVAASACPARTEPGDCLFYDSTHFRPLLGDAIVAAALAMRQSGFPS